MNLINKIVTSALVIVILVFVYYLYHTNLMNKLTQYNYDISSNPLLLNQLRTTDLLCPNDFTYKYSDNTSDFCEKNGTTCDTGKYTNDKNTTCNTYTAFPRDSNGIIQYPKDIESLGDAGDAIKNRCLKKDTLWTALDPYYYAKKCQDHIKIVADAAHVA